MSKNFLDLLYCTLRTPQGSVLNLPLFFLNVFAFHNILFLADGRKAHGFTYYLHTNELSHLSLSPEYLNCLLSISPWVSNITSNSFCKVELTFLSFSQFFTPFFSSFFLKPQVFLLLCALLCEWQNDIQLPKPWVWEAYWSPPFHSSSKSKLSHFVDYTFWMSPTIFFSGLPYFQDKDWNLQCSFQDLTLPIPCLFCLFLPHFVTLFLESISSLFT